MSNGVWWVWRFVLVTVVTACFLSFITNQFVSDIDDPETTRWDIGVIVWSLSLLCGILAARYRKQSGR